MAPVIRPATAADLPAINEIYNFYVATSPATFDTQPVSLDRREAWFTERSALGLPVLVADADGEAGGWCALSPWSAKKAYDTTRDESIYIADEFRGRGLGKALLGAVLQEARRLDVHVVMAGVVACQEASLALHRSLGFEQSALNLHMGYKLGSWHDVVYLQRHLWREGG
ncbi:MAG: GNAT family N-acetyltransferase [Anaerolinea sp.]|nr:GNAT family N-acetyltransferase [Anaerolinea sp.]